MTGLLRFDIDQLDVHISDKKDNKGVPVVLE
jgi:hypothetical protein